MTEHPLQKYYESFHMERNKKGTVPMLERFRFFRDTIGKSKRILELGCRYGNLLGNFLEGNLTVGVDIDKNALERCKAEYNIPVCCTDLNNRLPFCDSSFDVVILSEVLEHLPYPEITLSEVVRITRKNGVLIGSVPNGAHFRKRLRFMLKGIVDYDRTHLRHYTKNSLKSILDKYFRNIFIHPVGGHYRKLSTGLFAKYFLFRCYNSKREHSILHSALHEG